ncbi:MAG TPA: hypothetical protein VFZ56_00655 [Gemmatimonadaceae bacterium]
MPSTPHFVAMEWSADRRASPSAQTVGRIRLRYQPDAALPSLAWLARLDWDGLELRVDHGTGVETHPDFYFEGAWAGDFAEGRADDTEVAFGTGCVVRGTQVSFISSLATTDYLYYQTGAPLTISNSLALLLAALDDSLDPTYRQYDAINNTILQGVNDYVRDIPTRKGVVRRLMYHNLRCTSEGATEAPKPQPPDFGSFADYSGYLTDSYERLVMNARDERRRQPLRIYTTQSRGYDTTAVNAIARSHRVDGVFTVTRGKGEPGKPDPDDDGTEIAAALGIGPIIPIDRHAYSDGFADEIYFHASMHECPDANLRQIVDHIHGPALLLTGTLGEMWYTHSCGYADRPGTLHDGLARWDLGTHGLTEVRLRAGYVQAAIPYIGARKREQILRITESDEMTPWRTGSRYDRPIPRRLGEEAGAARETFGQVKIGSVVESPPPQTPRNATLAERYRHFLVQWRLRGAWEVSLLPLVQRLNGHLARAWWSRRYRLLYGPVRRLLRWRDHDDAPPVIWSDLRGSLFCFAVNECADEYARVLRKRAVQNS